MQPKYIDRARKAASWAGGDLRKESVPRVKKRDFLNEWYAFKPSDHLEFVI